MDARQVEQVLAHLCGKGLFGDVRQWCESRYDCVYVVTCPDCGCRFVLDEMEFQELVRRSSMLQVCGVSMDRLEAGDPYPRLPFGH
ncbi:MAG: hypothetical protein RMK01_04745 [Thermomicrobium sp.]|nr:hypothetical protein [Thermomicrobium sp.]